MYEPRSPRDLDDAAALASEPSRVDRAGGGATTKGLPPRRGATHAGAPSQSGDQPGVPSWQPAYADLWSLLAGQPGSDEEARDEQARDEFRSGERWGGLKRQQPSAAPIVEEFQPLPAWAGMTVDDFNPKNLVSQLPSLTASVGGGGRAMMPLANDWPERLAAGRTTHVVSTATHRVEMTVGYDGATPRGGNTYRAELAWRLEIVDLSDESREVKIHHGGSILFTTRTPVPALARKRPVARSADALALDPTQDADHRTDEIRCQDASPESDDCYQSPSARAELIASTTGSVEAAGQNFIRACETLAERLRKAAEADAAFAGAVVDCALGFGVSRLAAVASKQVSATLGPGAKIAEKGLEQLLGEPKAKLKHALTADSMSTTQKLVAAIRKGADGAFRQLAQIVASSTDAEIWLISRTFGAATQAHYEAQIAEFLAQYARQVAPIGEHQRPGGGDYAEFVVWMYDPAARRKRLGYVRAEERAGNDHGRPTSAQHRQLLGWVDDDMIPYALDRHQRLYGPVADWTLGLAE